MLMSPLNAVEQLIVGAVHCGILNELQQILLNIRAAKCGIAKRNRKSSVTLTNYSLLLSCELSELDQR